MQYGLIVFQMHYVKKKDVEALFSTESKMCVHLFFVRTPPLFRPDPTFISSGNDVFLFYA